MRLFVLKDSPVQSIAQLKGKNISVPFGSTAHAFLLRALQDAGLDPEKDVNLISKAPDVGGSALQANQIDAHANFVPFGELQEGRSNMGRRRRNRHHPLSQTL
jgi:NitT/TauT family transport system substrate-binding protein